MLEYKVECYEYNRYDVYLEIEKRMNLLSKEGWRVIAQSYIPTFGDKILITYEREVKPAVNSNFYMPD